MKKILSILLAAMLTIVTMSPTVIDLPPMESTKAMFIIKNLTTNKEETVYVKDFPSSGVYNVALSVSVEDELEITYEPLPSIFTPKASWAYLWNGQSSVIAQGSGFTAKGTVKNMPLLTNTLVFQFNYWSNDQSSSSTLYTMYFKNVQRGRQITAKNINASEVQVTYENYAEVASAGQRATVALYDIYGNPVSTGYLDNLGMSTLSTKGKPGIYIVKVTMNNQVIFNQRIQVK